MLWYAMCAYIVVYTHLYHTHTHTTSCGMVFVVKIIKVTSVLLMDYSIDTLLWKSKTLPILGRNKSLSRIKIQTCFYYRWLKGKEIMGVKLERKCSTTIVQKRELLNSWRTQSLAATSRRQPQKVHLSVTSK